MPRHTTTWALPWPDQGEADEAVACYRRALELKPDYAEAHNNLGIVLTAQGHLDEAVACGRRALELKPDYPEAHKTLADALCSSRSPDEAVALYRRALELKPDYAEAHNNLGNALLEQGKVDEAVACYRRALELKPDYPETHNNLGNALLEQGKLDEAIACFRRALELIRTPRGHNNLGVALRSRGSWTGGGRLPPGLELKPDYPEAHNNLGNALKDQGMVDEAEACWRRALELKPDSVETHNNLGIALKQQGKLDEAMASYRRALELKPDYAEAYNNLANALWEQGKTPEAEACWRRTIELKPDCADAYSNLGMMLYEKGRLAEAATILQRWLEYAPENPVARHMVAAFTGQDVPARAADEYVRSSFDHFARTFDKKLKRLDYHAPELVMAAVAEALGDPKGELDVLDAGCGTGWCGPLLRPYARRLTGVDLSPAMIEQARARQVYDDLIVAELTAHLEAAAGTLRSGGVGRHAGLLRRFEAGLRGGRRRTAARRPVDLHGRKGRPAPIRRGRGFFLQPHGRYCHTEDYVRRTLAEAGLSVREMTPGILRKELGQPVQGIVASACKRKLLTCRTTANSVLQGMLNCRFGRRQASHGRSFQRPRRAA